MLTGCDRKPLASKLSFVPLANYEERQQSENPCSLLLTNCKKS